MNVTSSGDIRVWVTKWGFIRISLSVVCPNAILDSEKVAMAIGAIPARTGAIRCGAI